MVKNTDHPVPLATIGLTCYNAKDTIIRAIKSAVDQNWPNKEIVIVDDCSGDSSVRMIEEIAREHSNIRLIRHEQNKGRASARNSVLKNAKGEFLAFFDDDDESFPDRVTEQINTILAYEKKTGAKYITCCASGIRRYSNGYTLSMPAIGSKGEVPHGQDVADYLLFYKRRPGWFYGGGVPTCALLARRSVLEEINGFEEGMKIGEDADLAIRLAFKGCHFIGTQKDLFIQHVTFAVDKSPEVNLRAEQFLAEKNEAYLRSINRYYYAVHWPKLRYWHFKRRYDLFVLEFLSLFVRHPIAVLIHFYATVPKRFLHERSMRRKAVK